MAKRRRFTPEFKAEVVIEALCGESSQAELCRKHNLSDVQLSKWKRQLLENAASSLNLLINRPMRLNSGSLPWLKNEALSKLCEPIIRCDRLNLRKNIRLNFTKLWSKKINTY